MFGQIVKLLLAIPSIIESVGKLADLVLAELRKRKAAKEKKKNEEASAKYKKANEIQNEEERKKAKADALCELDPTCSDK